MALVESEVVETVNVLLGETVVVLVAPSSSMRSWSPAATVLPELIEHVSMVGVFSPQPPTTVLAAVTSVTVPLAIVTVLDPDGNVRVIWLRAVPDIAPPVVLVENVAT